MLVSSRARHVFYHCGFFCARAAPTARSPRILTWPGVCRTDGRQPVQGQPLNREVDSGVWLHKDILAKHLAKFALWNCGVESSLSGLWMLTERRRSASAWMLNSSALLFLGEPGEAPLGSLRIPIKASANPQAW